jgi:hypothetical protein
LYSFITSFILLSIFVGFTSVVWMMYYYILVNTKFHFIISGIIQSTSD